ncbi:hypothetical protein [Haloferax sp. Atlit-12N]|uniref:hypothetical protein n=1 Tax=Haloferax sp. Atlit-12N TaxID=2077203 RepID=UPI0011E5BA67|nr:hypothetical protein [Haloferax sp. Atlit-12N]
MFPEIPISLSNPAVAAFIGAVAGGLFSFASTFFFNNRQRSIQSNRLRRALATELECLEIMELRIAVHTMQSQGILQQIIEDQLVNMAEEQLGEIPEGARENAQDALENISHDIIQSATPEAFEKVGLLLATPIYETNTGKIGTLDSDEIEQLIKFHRSLDLVRDEMGRVIETAEDGGDEDLQTRISTLESDLKELESTRKDVLKSLGFDTEELRLSEDVLTGVSEKDDQINSGLEENNIDHLRS